MGLETTFRGLSVSLHKLHDALNALHATTGDTPAKDESALAEGVENTALDLIGTLHEARKAAMQARRAVADPVDLNRARRALAVCQEQFHSLQQLFTAELVAYEKMKELARLGNERRAWLPWASMVKIGIEQCHEPLEKTSRALAACWGELAERLGTVNISMTTVGQQISVPKARTEDLEVEGVT
jgi:hypothetical protein